jgi:hypothetical protein
MYSIALVLDACSLLLEMAHAWGMGALVEDDEERDGVGGNEQQLDVPTTQEQETDGVGGNEDIRTPHEAQGIRR